MRILLIAIGFIALFACSESDSKKATTMSVPEMEPPVTANTPSSLTSLSLALNDSSPKICPDQDAPDCPTIAATVKGRLFGEGSGIVNLLDAMDGRITELEQRSAGSYVACMADEEDNLKTGTQSTFTFNPEVSTHSVEVYTNCHDTYTGPSAEGESAGQMVFGRDDSDTYYIVDRYKNGDNVRTMWGSQTQAEYVDAWGMNYGIDPAQNIASAILSHIISSPDGYVEFAIAAATDNNSGVDMVCGTQVKYNTEYLYITGKVAAPSTTGGTGCSAVPEVSYCLDVANNFQEAEASSCESAGLTTFTIDAISPSDIDADNWATTANVDYSDRAEQFTSESIESED